MAKVLSDMNKVRLVQQGSTDRLLKTVVCIKHESLMKCTFKPASPYYMYHNSIL
jgi:hypothetical protein